MNIDFFKDLENNFRGTEVRKFADNFITELTEHLEDFFEKVDIRKEKPNNQEEKLDNFREEDGLYQVVDLSSKGVFLQNMKTNVILEETNIPEDLKNVISNDYILRYKDGTYIWEEELTDKFYEGLIDVKEYMEKEQNSTNK